MAKSLAEIRAALSKADKSTAFTGGDNASYAFWNMPENETAVLRFLPDADENNSFFWQERQVLKFPFNGVINSEDDTSEQVTVQVPCLETPAYKSSSKCPVLSEVRTWWKDDSLHDVARTYWVKKSFLFQGFVTKSPLDEGDNLPENPIRRFTINKSIFDIIKASLWDEDMEELPTDYEHGLDFKLKKTKQGQYASYSASRWAQKSRPLNDEELAAIKEHGLFTLSDYLPKKPEQEELEVIQEMFKASVDGEPYDYARWGSFYTPSGYKTNNSGDSAKTSTPSKSTTTASKPKAAPVVDDDDDDEVSVKPDRKSSVDVSSIQTKAPKASVDEDDDSSGEAAPDPQAILDMIRQRMA